MTNDDKYVNVAFLWKSLIFTSFKCECPYYKRKVVRAKHALITALIEKNNFALANLNVPDTPSKVLDLTIQDSLYTTTEVLDS